MNILDRLSDADRASVDALTMLMPGNGETLAQLTEQWVAEEIKALRATRPMRFYREADNDNGTFGGVA